MRTATPAIHEMPQEDRVTLRDADSLTVVHAKAMLWHEHGQRWWKEGRVRAWERDDPAEVSVQGGSAHHEVGTAIAVGGRALLLNGVASLLSEGEQILRPQAGPGSVAQRSGVRAPDQYSASPVERSEKSVRTFRVLAIEDGHYEDVLPHRCRRLPRWGLPEADPLRQPALPSRQPGQVLRGSARRIVRGSQVRPRSRADGVPEECRSASLYLSYTK